VSAADDEFVTFRRVTVALGTFVSIEARAPRTVASARNSLDEACAVFDVVESTMHPSRLRSDLATIARAGRGELISVHAWTFDVLALARRLWSSSDGLFDPCVPERPGRLGDLELVAPGAVRRTGAEISLDLGGIAKGFAVDRATDALRAAGCVSGQVNAGGDVRVFGEERYTLHVRAGGIVTSKIALKNEALAVSEPKSPESPSAHRGFYSGVTGEAITGRAVAVCAGSAAVADALTKCAIVCGPEALERLLREHGARLLDLESPDG
jgi:thiamine biosynthesis lipoprotein